MEEGGGGGRIPATWHPSQADTTGRPWRCGCVHFSCEYNLYSVCVVGQALNRRNLAIPWLAVARTLL